jgi:hypothetical protein
VAAAVPVKYLVEPMARPIQAMVRMPQMMERLKMAAQAL